MKMLIYLLLAGEEVQFLFFELYAATRCINSFVIVDLLEPPPSGGAYVEVKTTPRIDVGQCQCKSTPDVIDGLQRMCAAWWNACSCSITDRTCSANRRGMILARLRHDGINLAGGHSVANEGNVQHSAVHQQPCTGLGLGQWPHTLTLTEHCQSVCDCSTISSSPMVFNILRRSLRFVL